MPNRKKKHGKGEIVNWEITVNEKDHMYFLVSITWENGVTRNFCYQFNTEDEFWKRWEMFKRNAKPNKEILDELWTEVVHSYAAGRMVYNQRMEHTHRKIKSSIPQLADDSFIERWLSVPSMRELCDDSAPQD